MNPRRVFNNFPNSSHGGINIRTTSSHEPHQISNRRTKHGTSNFSSLLEEWKHTFVSIYVQQPLAEFIPKPWIYFSSTFFSAYCNYPEMGHLHVRFQKISKTAQILASAQSFISNLERCVYMCFRRLLWLTAINMASTWITVINNRLQCRILYIHSSPVLFSNLTSAIHNELIGMQRRCVYLNHFEYDRKFFLRHMWQISFFKQFILIHVFLSVQCFALNCSHFLTQVYIFPFPFYPFILEWIWISHLGYITERIKRRPTGKMAELSAERWSV